MKLNRILVIGAVAFLSPFAVVGGDMLLHSIDMEDGVPVFGVSYAATSAMSSELVALKTDQEKAAASPEARAAPASRKSPYGDLSAWADVPKDTSTSLEAALLYGGVIDFSKQNEEDGLLAIALRLKAEPQALASLPPPDAER